MYDKLAILSPFLFSPKKREKENELTKPVLNKFFLMIHSIITLLKIKCSIKNGEFPKYHSTL